MSDSNADKMEHLGRQWHPNVDHYQSGGLGHLEGDPTRSVVGFIPTTYAHQAREYNRADRDANPDSHEVISKITGDIKSGKGITTPVTIHYNHEAQWGFVGEGNHRIAAARAAGAPVVPARFVRASRESVSSRRARGQGSHMVMGTQFGNEPGYTPTDIHPNHFLNFSDGSR